MNLVIARETQRLKKQPSQPTQPNSIPHRPARKSVHHDVGSQRSTYQRKHSLTSTSLPSPQSYDEEKQRSKKYRKHSCDQHTVKYNRLRMEMRIWMFQSSEGTAWDVWIMFLCLISVGVFILQTYIEDPNSAESAVPSNQSAAVQNYLAQTGGDLIIDVSMLLVTQIVELGCAIFFTVDLILNLFVTNRPCLYLWCSWGLIDLITCIPVFVELSFQGFSGKQLTDAAILSLLSLLRFARVFKVTRFLREMRLQRMLKTHVTLMKSRIISSIIVICAIWLLFSSLVYVAEVEIPSYWHQLAVKDYQQQHGLTTVANYIRDHNITNTTMENLEAVAAKMYPPGMEPFQKKISFGQAVYFSMVTFSTVGFGDISPDTSVGQWVVITMIVIGLGFIATRVAEVGILIGSISKYSHRVEQGDNGHILVMGHVQDSRIVQHFLDEHLHPDHFGKMSNYSGPEDVVLVGGCDPHEDVKQDVLQSAHYGGKVRYFKGSIMSQKDLHNMALRKASAVFLLSDLHSTDPKREDSKTVVAALILRDFDPDAKIFAEVHGKEAAQHLSQLVQPNAVVCIDELRAHLMAATVNLPGLSTLFDNLCCAFSRPDPDERRPNWLSEYFEGADKELYRIRCPAALAGMTFVDAAVHIFEASSFDFENMEANENNNNGGTGGTDGGDQIREDDQVILVACDIGDELFTNPGDWFHLPSNDEDREEVFHHGDANSSRDRQNRRTSFSVRTTMDEQVEQNRGRRGSVGENFEVEDPFPCIDSTFLYVIASDKKNANEIERIGFEKWKTIKTDILKRSASFAQQENTNPDRPPRQSTMLRVGSFLTNVVNDGRPSLDSSTANNANRRETSIKLVRSSVMDVRTGTCTDSTHVDGIELVGVTEVKEEEEDDDDDPYLTARPQDTAAAERPSAIAKEKSKSLCNPGYPNPGNATKLNTSRSSLSSVISLKSRSMDGGGLSERAASRGWWRIDGQPGPPSIVAGEAKFHPSQLQNHVIICGAIRELGSFAATLRHLRHRALLTVGQRANLDDIVMPIVVLADCTREEATNDWGLLGAKKSQLRDVYHVQENSATEIGLRSAGVEHAKYILIVADPQGNAGGNVGGNSASGNGLEESHGGNGNPGSGGGAEGDHEDVKTLITYLAIDNCLIGKPMKTRPSIVCEAGSSMCMHVLTSRRFANIEDSRIGHHHHHHHHHEGAANGLGAEEEDKEPNTQLATAAATTKVTLSVDVHLGSHPSGSYHRPKVPRPMSGRHRRALFQTQKTVFVSSSKRRTCGLCCCCCAGWLLRCYLKCCIGMLRKLCCFQCCTNGHHSNATSTYNHGEHNGRDFLGIPFFTAGFAFTSRFVDTLVVQARYTPGLLEVFECLTAVRSPLIEADGCLSDDGGGSEDSDQDKEEGNAGHDEGHEGHEGEPETETKDNKQNRMETKESSHGIRQSHSAPAYPGSHDPFQSRVETIAAAHQETEKRDLGSIQKIEVPVEFVGLPFRTFFRGMTSDYGIVPIALYRGVDVHENDNKLPYVYTCPSPDALLMEGDSAFVLVKPKRITRRERNEGSMKSTGRQRSRSRSGSKSGSEESGRGSGFVGYAAPSGNQHGRKKSRAKLRRGSIV